MIQDNPLIQKLVSLNLPKDDFAVFGSGPMFAHGLKDLGHDIDVVASSRAWEQALKLGNCKNDQLGVNKVIEFFNGQIEVFNGWAPGEWDVNKLISEAEEIEGIKFVKLVDVIKWK